MKTKRFFDGSNMISVFSSIAVCNAIKQGPSIEDGYTPHLLIDRLLVITNARIDITLCQRKVVVKISQMTGRRIDP